MYLIKKLTIQICEVTMKKLLFIIILFHLTNQLSAQPSGICGNDSRTRTIQNAVGRIVVYSNDDINQPNQALFASITNENMNNGDSIEIILRLSKSEFYQGESINVLISINNYLNDTISLERNFHEYLLEAATNKMNDGGYYTSHSRPIRIPPFGNYKSIVEVQGVFGSQADNLLPPGTYEYWISHYVLKSRKIFSNKVRFTILEPPDSLKTQLEELLSHPPKYRTFEEAKVLYERYKDSFYGGMALRKLLGYPSMEPTLRIELSKRFIVNCPNTTYAYYEFIKLTYSYDENKNVIEDIIKELKMKQPDCFLFELLKNRPDDIETYRKIKQLITER